jgi:uncharacterized membrane protein
MTRNIAIDELRGMAFLLMIFHHINYFKDIANNFTTNYSKVEIVDISGKISRNMFIFLVGFTMYEAYNQKKTFKDYAQKRFERSLVIGAHALLITLISHHYFPQFGIKFGVLHFISLASLLSTGFVSYPKVAGLIAFILSYVNTGNFPYSFGEPFDLVLGTNIRYNMMDYFPMIKWLPVLLGGIFSGYLYKNPDARLFGDLTFFEQLGKQSLNLYTAHFIILSMYYNVNNL